MQFRIKIPTTNAFIKYSDTSYEIRDGSPL
jgi:hypothetical protein